MKIGILGTGMVGNTIGSKLIQLGHEVKMGSRAANNQKASDWAIANGKRALYGTFADAAAFGEIVFNCTSGSISLEALKLAEAKNLFGKILVDLANPLNLAGDITTLTVCNTDSLAEQIQRSYPQAKVVKTLNTMNCRVMVNPSSVPGNHHVFISGNDAEAKTKVVEILKTFGWKNIIDLGDIEAARGTEMLLPIWLRLMKILNTTDFNFAVVK